MSSLINKLQYVLNVFDLLSESFKSIAQQLIQLDLIPTL